MWIEAISMMIDIIIAAICWNVDELEIQFLALEVFNEDGWKNDTKK